MAQSITINWPSGEQIRAIMRCSRSRMLLHHPMSWQIRYLIDDLWPCKPAHTLRQATTIRVHQSQNTKPDQGIKKGHASELS
ncbi:MAG: hypothetical protein ACR5LD_07080 [Symbiopectobacterium sp.]